MFRRNRQNAKMESLLAHLVYFNALRTRHQHWADEMGDGEIAQMHDEINDLVLQLQNKYDRLLALYDKLDHHKT